MCSGVVCVRMGVVHVYWGWSVSEWGWSMCNGGGSCVRVGVVRVRILVHTYGRCVDPTVRFGVGLTRGYESHSVHGLCGVTGWCPIYSGLVLSAQEPVKAGSPVGLASKPAPHSLKEVKSIVIVSHDKSCDKSSDTSHTNHVTSAAADKSVPHTSHERSHRRADELHLSRQPSWKKNVEVQVEETGPPSAVGLQERCSMQ